MTDRLAINLATIRKQYPLAQALNACVRHKVSAVAPWRDQIANAGLETAAKLIRDSGLSITGLCRGGAFTAADAAGRAAAIDDNRRAIDEAATIGAAHLVLVVGTLPPGSRDIAGARQMVEDGLAAVLPYARERNMPLAIEPLHPMYCGDRACVSTLAQALDLCERLGDGTGVVVDTYHTWWDPDAASQIARAGRMGAILAYHISDWLVPTTDLLNDRGMMGDGVIDFPRMRAMVDAAGYRGPQEVEIFSDRWWSRPGDEVLATCVERFRTVC